MIRFGLWAFSNYPLCAALFHFKFSMTSFHCELIQFNMHNTAHLEVISGLPDPFPCLGCGDGEGKKVSKPCVLMNEYCFGADVCSTCLSNL